MNLAAATVAVEGGTAGAELLVDESSWHAGRHRQYTQMSPWACIRRNSQKKDEARSLVVRRAFSAGQPLKLREGQRSDASGVQLDRV